MKRTISVIALSFMSFFFASCFSTPKQEEVIECTVIGCEDSLSINLVGDVPEEYRVDLVINDMILSRECISIESSEASSISAHADCREWGVIFWGFSPEEAVVRVYSGELLIEEDIRPIYEIFQPNGFDCPPICRVGSAIVRLQ